MAIGTSQPAFIYTTAYVGPGDASKQLALQYQSASSLTASVVLSTLVTLAASASLQAVNLSTLFAGANAATSVFVAITDITTTGSSGFSFSTNSAGPSQNIAANGNVNWTSNGTAPSSLGTVYLSNLSSTQALTIQISIIAE